MWIEIVKSEELFGFMEITDLNEQELGRRASLQKLHELGIEPYPAAEFPVNASTRDIKEGFDPEKGNFKDIRIAGRMMSRRIMGAASFIDRKSVV